MMKKHSLPLFITLSILTGCNTSSSASSFSSISIGSSNIASIPTSFSSIVTGSYEPLGTDVQINIDEQDVNFIGQNAFISRNGPQISITGAGIYIFTGTSSNMQIRVNAPSQNVKLVLNGLSLTSTINAPIYFASTNKGTVEMAPGSINYLEDAATYTYETGTTYPKATIYSRDDMDIQGSGYLMLIGNFNNGIHSDNDLCIDGDEFAFPQIVINAVDNGLKGNDTVTINYASMLVESGGDAIKADNNTELNKGTITINNGYIGVTCSNDAISAYRAVRIHGGDISINTGLGSNYTVGLSSPSMKAIKSELEVLIAGGTIFIDSQDHGISSNGDINILGGNTTISSGDDGVRADGTFLIQNGDLSITKSFEGLAATHISILGGRIRIISSEDGLSASGGETGLSINSGSVSIAAGYLYIDALGDGIDSNGNITITGGTTIINGPSANNNGPLDIGDRGYKLSISGGILIATGSKGMAINANEGTQFAALFKHNTVQSLSSTYVLTDANNSPLFAFKPSRNSNSMMVSISEFTEGTYKIYLNTSYIDSTYNEDGFMDGGSFSGGTLLNSWSFSSGQIRYTYNQ